MKPAAENTQVCAPEDPVSHVLAVHMRMHTHQQQTRSCGACYDICLYCWQHPMHMMSQKHQMATPPCCNVLQVRVATQNSEHELKLAIVIALLHGLLNGISRSSCEMNAFLCFYSLLHT
jgi:hypothetical protein